MIGQTPGSVQPAESKRDMFQVASHLNGQDYGTLLLERGGLIASCGAPAERIFRARNSQMHGRHISEFISGLFLIGSSPSYSARYLVHLCTDGEWRKFQAKDVDGAGFMLELNLSRIVTEGQEMFLLNVRRAGEDRYS